MKNHTAIMLFGFLLSSSFAFADASPDMMAMLEKMQRQIAQMQQTIDQQNLRIQQLESSRVPEKIEAPSTPPEAAPWLKGVKSAGDIRLRFESFDYFDKSDAAGATDRSRNRFRIRLRWGLEKDFGDDWKAGFRLATGAVTDQTSQNVTLGNPGYFQYKTFLVDRAYVNYAPSALKDIGPLKAVNFGGGKVENPFLRYSTGIVWDTDVTPEGIYEKADFRFIDTEKTKLNLFTTFGQFFVNEDSAADKDAELIGYQGALNLSTHMFGMDKPTDFTAGASYYDYPNWFQTVTANSSGTSYLRTNTSALDDPRVLDIYPEIAFYAGNTPVTLWYDYAKNVGTIDPVRAAMNEAHADDDAWGLGFKIGKAKAKGSWELFYGYYEIAPNAVAAAFNDSDLGGPGGVGFTNRRGHKFGLSYQWTGSLTLGWTSFLVEPLYPTPVSANSADESVVRSQFDASYKF